MAKLSKTNIPTEQTYYPSGVFIKTEKGYYYIFNSTKRYRIISKRLLDSWSPLRVIVTSEAAVVKYRVAAKLKFRNGSLLYNYADAKMYLISEGKRRLIASPDVLPRLGFKGANDSLQVSVEEINLHEEGEPLT